MSAKGNSTSGTRSSRSRSNVNRPTGWSLKSTKVHGAKSVCVAASGQMRDIALEIPFGALALIRARQRGDAALARVEHAREHLDRAALARGVATFEDDHHALAGLGHPPRHRAKLARERLQQLLIFLVAELGVTAHQRPLLKHCCRMGKRRWELRSSQPIAAGLRTA